MEKVLGDLLILENPDEGTMTALEFCDLLQQIKNCPENDRLSIDQVKNLVDLFLCNYWRLEEGQDALFEDLGQILERQTESVKAKTVEYLLDKQRWLYSLVLIAQKIADTLSREWLKDLWVGSTNDSDETRICKPEFIWRKKHSLPCEQIGENLYVRPISFKDVECFKALLKLACRSGHSIFIC